MSWLIKFEPNLISVLLANAWKPLHQSEARKQQKFIGAWPKGLKSTVSQYIFQWNSNNCSGGGRRNYPLVDQHDARTNLQVSSVVVKVKGVSDVKVILSVINKYHNECILQVWYWSLGWFVWKCAETKKYDGRMDKWTDGRTDRQTNPFLLAGDKKTIRFLT